MSQQESNLPFPRQSNVPKATKRKNQKSVKIQTVKQKTNAGSNKPLDLVKTMTQSALQASLIKNPDQPLISKTNACVQTEDPAKTIAQINERLCQIDLTKTGLDYEKTQLLKEKREQEEQVRKQIQRQIILEEGQYYSQEQLSQEQISLWNQQKDPKIAKVDFKTTANIFEFKDNHQNEQLDMNQQIVSAIKPQQNSPHESKECILQPPDDSEVEEFVNMLDQGLDLQPIPAVAQLSTNDTDQLNSAQKDYISLSAQKENQQPTNNINLIISPIVGEKSIEVEKSHEDDKRLVTVMEVSREQFDDGQSMSFNHYGALLRYSSSIHTEQKRNQKVEKESSRKIEQNSILQEKSSNLQQAQPVQTCEDYFGKKSLSEQKINRVSGVNKSNVDYSMTSDQIGQGMLCMYDSFSQQKSSSKDKSDLQLTPILQQINKLIDPCSPNPIKSQNRSRSPEFKFSRKSTPKPAQQLEKLLPQKPKPGKINLKFNDLRRQQIGLPVEMLKVNPAAAAPIQLVNLKSNKIDDVLMDLLEPFEEQKIRAIPLSQPDQFNYSETSKQTKEQTEENLKRAKLFRLQENGLRSAGLSKNIVNRLHQELLDYKDNQTVPQYYQCQD